MRYFETDVNLSDLPFYDMAISALFLNWRYLNLSDLTFYNMATISLVLTAFKHYYNKVG